MKNVIFTASAECFAELSQLRALILKYDGIVVTEKTPHALVFDKTVFMPYTNPNEITFLFKFIYMIFKSLYLVLRHRPAVILATGEHTSIPLMFWGKIFKKEVIYIETIADCKNISKTGKFAKMFSTKYLVQWEELCDDERIEYWGRLY